MQPYIKYLTAGISAVIIVLCTALTCAAQVKPGVEVLRDGGFAQLRGKRVGLLTNPTGVDRNLKSTIDILHGAPGVKLTALFAPEHGVRGDVTAGAAVANGTDRATGVKVHSLYGRTRKPTAAMLADVDAVVYDIQDNGCRSYTFISSMGKVMEACAEQGKEFILLDRPNPLGGEKVEGNLAEKDCISFVSQYPIPYIYGLTPGELATYINEKGLLGGGKKVKLTVVPMEGWKRSMTYDETGLPWVLTSPHIPTAATTLYYPATGIMGELDYASIGVGYTMPFKLVCAGWIDAEKLCRRLQALKLPGVAWRPIHIKPYYGLGKGTQMHGVELYVTDPAKAQLTLIQFYVMQELAAMYPQRAALASATAERLAMFDKVCGSKQIRMLFGRRHKVADMLEYWNKDAATFRAASTPYLLY